MIKSKRPHTAVATAVAPSRPEDKLRRYLHARERLESRRRDRPERFAHLRRMHD